MGAAIHLKREALKGIKIERVRATPRAVGTELTALATIGRAQEHLIGRDKAKLDDEINLCSPCAMSAFKRLIASALRSAGRPHSVSS